MAARISSRSSPEMPSTRQLSGKSGAASQRIKTVRMRTSPTMRTQCEVPAGIHSPRVGGTTHCPCAVPTTSTPCTVWISCAFG